MEQEGLNLYRIDMKYIRNLHNIDDRVSSVSPQIGKQHRIYVGTVVVCNEHKYLIPLSHPVEKHKKMSPRADFDKIYDKKGKLLGVLNYNLMIPVEDRQLIKVNLKEDKRDTIVVFLNFLVNVYFKISIYNIPLSADNSIKYGLRPQ